MRDYKKIAAWQRADELTLSIYAKTRSFPQEEIFGVTHQIRKASYSVAAHIAEGARRESKREYLHFLIIARGSLSETEYFLHLSHKLSYLSLTEYASLTSACNRAFAALHGLIESVKKEASVFTRGLALFKERLSALRHQERPFIDYKKLP
ncbi:four helix bundle protein [Candidatus Poribacteria bacterium]|nr:four helix bundle protein [Candidatus Poribacteria bacterium]